MSAPAVVAAQQDGAIARRRVDADGQQWQTVAASELRAGDEVLVEAGELIPGDGEIIEGLATVDESAITGESAPVIRESGGDRSAVTGGTRVLSDRLRVRITAAAGSSFLDRMIALVEGASRQKTPNEIALNILLAGLSLIFVLATATIPGFDTELSSHRWAIESSTIDGNHVLLAALAPLALVGLLVYLYRTESGTAVRGLAENVERARLLGIPVNRLTLQLWAIIGGLAAGAPSVLIDDQIDHLDFSHPTCRCYLALWGYLPPGAKERARAALTLEQAVGELSLR